MCWIFNSNLNSNSRLREVSRYSRNFVSLICQSKTNWWVIYGQWFFYITSYVAFSFIFICYIYSSLSRAYVRYAHTLKPKQSLFLTHSLFPHLAMQYIEVVWWLSMRCLIGMENLWWSKRQFLVVLVFVFGISCELNFSLCSLWGIWIEILLILISYDY